MSVYYQDDHVTLHLGDCIKVMRELPAESVDAVCTDPPYGLGFMGKAWDDLPPGVEWAAECLRVLKPGGHLLAFGGSRTWHRLAVAVEDAGFEIRDSIAWLYGSGFPKSLDVSKAIDKAAGAERASLGVVKGAASSKTDSLGVFAPEYQATAPATDDAKRWQGWGTALKPAFEPIVMGRKPIVGTVAGNVLAHGTGALNIDAARIAGDNPSIARRQGATSHLDGGRAGAAAEHAAAGRVVSRTSPARFAEARAGEQLGRWPANVVLDEHQAAELDRQSGVQRDGVAVQRNGGGQALFGGIGGGVNTVGARPDAGYGAGGGASRFFYVAKAGSAERPKLDGQGHPTVKPLELMRWLVRLVTPSGGTVLEPFLGSGTTAEACIVEGFRCIGIERDPQYMALVKARLAKPISPVLDFGVGA